MQAMWQQPRHDMVVGKQPGKEGWERGAQKQELPLPLTQENLNACLAELNSGTRRAVETCIECFQNNRMSKEDLLCFMQSICSQGPMLKSLFSKQQVKGMGERASDADIAALRALTTASTRPSVDIASSADAALSATSAQFGDLANDEEMAELRALAAFSGPQKANDPVCAVVHGSDVPMTAGATRPNTAPTSAAKPKPTRVRRAKITEPTDEEKALMAWWSERRIPEILRRQTESCDTNGCTSDAAKRVAYMKFVMTQLRDQLPTAGQTKLLALVTALQESGNDEQFSSAVKELVDEYGVSVRLSFAPEVTVRKQRRRFLAADVAMDENEDEELPDADNAPTTVKAEPKKESEETKEPLKRKRTETLKGAEPKVGEDEEEDARCPVCVGCPQEDDRWVKCDGCSSWYHQICVLFNEQAHGKSVRFFCRTPQCRKRGSRQLNRRQRKPCYPSSPGLESSNLGDRLSKFAQQFSRQDRQIVVKMVANQTHTREAGGRGREEETVQSKTLLCFQHTMIGSDLLFLVLFVDEIRCADGSGRVEITHVDSNGLYEGLEAAERQRVEGSVLVGYLEHAADCGFASASVTLRDNSAEGNSLFYARPQAQAWSGAAEAHAFVNEALAEAQTGGLVNAFGDDEEAGTATETVVRVRLNVDKAAVDPVDVDAEMRSMVAGRPSEWAELMSGNNYRFDSLQFSKFSSMMLVYHVIKGSKRQESSGRATAVPPPSSSHSALPPISQEVSEDEEAMELDLSARAAKRPRAGPDASLKREESAPIQQHVPQPPPRPPIMFESPMIHASSAMMPSPMVRYSVFTGPSESPAIRASTFPGTLESPATFPAVWRGPGESPATMPSMWRGPGESPATMPSMWRGPGESPATRPISFPGESPATGASIFRGPGESPATFPTIWRGPGESPATMPSMWRGTGDSPATRPVAFPGESPATRPVAFPMQSPNVRALMASPHVRNAHRGVRSPPRVPSLGASNAAAGHEGGGNMEPIFSFSDSMLEDVVDQSLGSAFSENNAANQDPFWDHFLTQLQQ